MVQNLELQVPFIPTDENPADFFTKPLDKKKFQHFRGILMNETPLTALSRAILSVTKALYSSTS